MVIDEIRTNWTWRTCLICRCGSVHIYNQKFTGFAAYEEDNNPIVSFIATAGSILLLILTFPISIWTCFKVVQEYERAVIFRLGRARKGGARGPGIFFVLPCTDNYSKVDLRTVSFDVPPQEVSDRYPKEQTQPILPYDRRRFTELPVSQSVISYNIASWQLETGRKMKCVAVRGPRESVKIHFDCN